MRTIAFVIHQLGLCLLTAWLGFFLGQIFGRRAAYRNASKWVRELTDQIKRINKK